ncbi:hypothetical protein G9A89_003846 [Geosiphon pyriformis]|nr:hypothetical protein G9A89_003846 [Geosiphon pyriformis]
MNIQKYQQLQHYINTQQFKKNLSQMEQKNIKQQSKYFITYQNILYRKNRRNLDQPTRVITEPEKETILFNMYSNPTAEHFYKEATMERTRKKYYWPSIYLDIIQYVQNCDASDNIQRSQEKQKERHDNQLPNKPVEFKIGDKVLLHHTKVEKQWSKKFDPKWNELFHIEEILGNGAYKLKLNNKILTKAAHEDRLKPYYHIALSSTSNIPQLGVQRILIQPDEIP